MREGRHNHFLKSHFVQGTKPCTLYILTKPPEIGEKTVMGKVKLIAQGHSVLLTDIHRPDSKAHVHSLILYSFPRALLPARSHAIVPMT